MHNKNRFMPLLMALCVVVGILIGTFYANHLSGNRLSIINSSGNKLNSLLQIVNDQYVDTVNMEDMVEGAMPKILSELDPHSVYIAAKDVQIANDDLRGSFSGVGIEFMIDRTAVSHYLLYAAFLIVVGVQVALGLKLRKETAEA